MTEAEKAWCAGVFSAFGIASRRGRKPSLMVMAFTRELPDRLIALTGFGHVMGGIKVRWVCDEPHEVAAFYALTQAWLIESRKKMIEDAWKDWRVWIQDKQGEDPGWIDEYGNAEIQERRWVPGRRKVQPVWPTTPHVDGEVEAWEEGR